jgi:multidrug resistance efflux pump
VRVGDQVKAGDPLFKIDDRALQARLAVARAKVGEAEAALAKPRHRLEFLSRLQRKDNSAISAESISDARDDARATESALASAKAEAGQIQVEIERSLVRAPSPGRILQINTRVGEYVEGGGQAKPLLLLGDDARMFLRVDIDENDAWRVRPAAPARAFVRGNPRLAVALQFEYVEPYVAPKTALTGQSTERSDVRVLQVIYSFPRGALPVYLGQQMDVFIEAPPVASPTGKPQP